MKTFDDYYKENFTDLAKMDRYEVIAMRQGWNAAAQVYQSEIKDLRGRIARLHEENSWLDSQGKPKSVI